MITTKKAYPYVEVTCEPDDEYEYWKCESTVAGLFFIRDKDGLSNIWVAGDDGEGIWGEKAYDSSKMKPEESCSISRVTETVTRTLPMKKALEAAKFN
jgi:hypothetical protein